MYLTAVQAYYIYLKEIKKVFTNEHGLLFQEIIKIKTLLSIILLLWSAITGYSNELIISNRSLTLYCFSVAYTLAFNWQAHLLKTFHPRRATTMHCAVKVV